MTESVKLEEKSQEEPKSEQINPARCPVCGIETSYVYLIHEGDTGDKAKWYRCQCGILFQENLPVHGVYNEKYFVDYAGMKEGKTRLIHSARTYGNLIEELTYGRMMLDVGFCTPNVMEFFKDRGWLTWGIDCNESLEGGGSIYKGDFSTYDFSIPVDKTKLKEITGEDSIKREFDMIWMNHTFEHFNNPLGILKKCHDLLSHTGVLFIGVPDADFINKTGVPGYPHWKMKEHYTLWTEGALRRELERLGFKVIMLRRNYSSRFASWYDIHCIAQRNYF